MQITFLAFPCGHFWSLPLRSASLRADQEVLPPGPPDKLFESQTGHSAHGFGRAGHLVPV